MESSLHAERCTDKRTPRGNFSCLCKSARNYIRLQLVWNMHIEMENYFYLSRCWKYVHSAFRTVGNSFSKFLYKVPKTTININIHVLTPHQFSFKLNEKWKDNRFSKKLTYEFLNTYKLWIFIDEIFRKEKTLKNLI